MRHRERVLMALNHEEPDRCPMQISFTPEFAARLRKELKTGGASHNPHGGGNTYQLEQALDQQGKFDNAINRASCSPPPVVRPDF